MSGHRMFRYLILTVSAMAGLACGDFTSATSPTNKSVPPAANTAASFSRYILISGVSVCVENCDQ